MAQIYNFEIEQGCTFKKKIVWKDSTGTPIEIINNTAKMHIRSLSGGLIIELSTENGRIELATGGVINLNISYDKTNEIQPALYVYDLEIYIGSEVTRLIQGEITVTRGVTHE